MIRSFDSTPPKISSVAPKSRPMVIGCKRTLLSLSTTATRGPSARKSIAFTGIVMVALIPVLGTIIAAAVVAIGFIWSLFKKCHTEGFVYRGLKPVYWCIFDHTALAEAEVEYEDHTSPSIWVKFAVAEDGKAAELGADVTAVYTGLPGASAREGVAGTETPGPDIGLNNAGELNPIFVTFSGTCPG